MLVQMWAGFMWSLRFGGKKLREVGRVCTLRGGKGNVDWWVVRAWGLDVEERRGDVPQVEISTSPNPLHSHDLKEQRVFN